MIESERKDEGPADLRDMLLSVLGRGEVRVKDVEIG